MDKDLGRLHDAARESLKSRRDELIANKGSSSVLKKTRKVISQLDWGVEQYADELDNLMSRNASADDIRSYIRGVEEKALKDFQLLADDSVHHKVQSRTGGDMLSNAKSSHVRNVIKRLEDQHVIFTAILLHTQIQILNLFESRLMGFACCCAWAYLSTFCQI